MLSIIACIGKNRELGRGGELCFHIPEDMRFFKEMTMGHQVLMGRKTWESLPRKLRGREDMVVSRGEVPGADRVIHDLEAFLQENQATEEEIFVIGGEMVYMAALPYAKNLYLTEVGAEFTGADAYFPEFDKKQYSKEVIKEGKDNELEYSFVRYIKDF